MLYQTQNPHGGDLYSRPVTVDFSANTNPLGTPEGVRQAVLDSVYRLNQYPDPYCRELVRAIAGFEQLPEEYILCGCGAAELIFSYCSAIKAKTAPIIPFLTCLWSGVRKKGQAPSRADTPPLMHIPPTSRRRSCP